MICTGLRIIGLALGSIPLMRHECNQTGDLVVVPSASVRVTNGGYASSRNMTFYYSTKDFKWTAYSLTKETWNCDNVSLLGTVGNCRRLLSTIEMQDYIFAKWTNGLDGRTILLVLAMIFPPLIASDSFVRWDKRVHKTEEEVRLEAIDQSLITRKVGQDVYEVRAKATYCEKFRRLYKSIQAKYLLRFVRFTGYNLSKTS